ncbi:MAG: M28 family peptidase [Anaerolineaceae bacterium]|nr:MAG: M28 family peptidase [Anaerolineaceae bacterium]
MTKRILLLTLGALALILSGLYLWQYSRLHRQRPQGFDGQRAYQDVVYQVSLGPRTPGSEAHEKAIDYFRSELQKANWEVEVQIVEVNGHTLKNVIARRSDVPPQVILGAHFDSRLMADKDPDPKKQLEPVPGANDGASGTAVLLELGRVLPSNSVPIWLVFFDGEDQGNLPGWEEWSLGARGFVDAFSLKPRAVVIVDMVGDYNLNIHPEKQSSQRLINEIWQVAHDLGYGQYFLEERKYSIMDDHVPFLEAGIPAVDIIDIEYRYWHTSYDLPENVSPISLGIVGSTLQVWLGQQKGK